MKAATPLAAAQAKLREAREAAQRAETARVALEEKRYQEEGDDL